MIIGLTGGIASGKSTVSKYLAEKGFKVYDADKIAKDISEKKSVQEEIILTFGDKILDENGNIDRKKLKEVVFKNKEKLKQLNTIVHPKVIDFYKELKEQNTDEIITKILSQNLSNPLSNNNGTSKIITSSVFFSFNFL